MNSLSATTRVVYKRSWEHFKQVCQIYDQHQSPASVNCLLIYIAFCSCECFSYSTVLTRMSAIAFVHRFRRQLDNTQHFLVRKALAGYKNVHHKIDQRKPISISLLRKMCDNLDKVFTEKYNVKLFKAMFLLAFHAFLRVGEITGKPVNSNTLLLRNVEIIYKNAHPVGLNVNFDRFKHSKGRKFTLYIAASNNSLCAVRALVDYFSVRPKQHSILFVFPSGESVSSAYFNTILRSAILLSQGSHVGYSSHSFRIGAASYCLSKNISKNLIMSLGRWRTNSVEKYFRLPSFSI